MFLNYEKYKNNPVKNPEIPKIALSFSNGMLYFGILYSIIIVIFSISKIYYPFDYIFEYPVNTQFYYITIFLGIISGILFTLGLKLKYEFKVNLALIMFAGYFSIYLFEIYLVLRRNQKTEIQIIREYTNAGFEIYPNLHPGLFIENNGLISNNGHIFPLGGISNVYTITGSDVIETDEHGFNNSKGLYNKNTVDIVLSGGSFAQGFDVKPNENICAILRESGFNAISIGMNGNGPLREFASLREYAKPLKPSIVLLSSAYGDLKDIGKAFQSKFLIQYFDDDGFEQNLILRQTEIDSVLVKYVRQQYKRINESEVKIDRKMIEYHWFSQILKLYNTRKRFNLVPKSIFMINQDFDDERIIFKTIISKSKRMISSWEGKLYFIYIPLFDHATGNELNPKFNLEYDYHKFILNLANELNIPVIDIFKEVFNSHPDPASLFPNRTEGHYNAKGFRLMAKAISNRLEADRVFPSN